jgi:4-hydroxybenzoate polyprenyltransferase
MSWLEIAAIAVLLIGIGAGGYLVAQRPTFWWGLGVIAFKAAWPFLSKRMTPEQEKAFQDCVRRGGEWDPFRKRCK